MTTPLWTTSPAVLRAEEAEAPGRGPIIEGTAVPYGQTWESPSGYRETFAAGAFREEVGRWMAREDGARLPFMESHGGAFLGAVTELREDAAGVSFRAELRDTPAAHDYAERVRLGANGVSIEFVPSKSAKSRDGAMVHKAARLAAIAGALTPAYDAARVAARSEETMDTRETPEPEPTPEPPKEPEAPQATALSAERRDAEAATLRTVTPSVSITRPELVYGPRSEHGFLSDAYHAWQGDTAAHERQDRHYAFLRDTVEETFGRAGEVLSSEIPGAYPSEYMPGLLIERILKGRPMGSFYDRFTITDARPRIYPKVTTSTTVAAQSAEGVNPAASDFGTTAVTITPLLYGGETAVSRQVLDGADPAAESMILNDLMEAYAQTSEAAVKTAVEAGSTDLSVTLTAATPHAGIVDMVIAHQGAVFMPAQATFLPSGLYASLLKQADSAGRLLVPWAGPSNASGEQGNGGAGASVLGVPVIHSWASTTAVAVTGRRSDFAIFESSIARFSFDQGAGAPASIRVGLWAYLATGARRGSLKETAV